MGPFAQLIDLTDRHDKSLDYYDVRSCNERSEPRVDEQGRVRSKYGGLVVATFPGYETGMILLPHASGGLQSLARLNIRPSLRMENRSPQSVRCMVRLGRLWTRIGSVMDSRALDLQSKVNEAVVAELSRVICGNRWWNLMRIR